MKRIWSLFSVFAALVLGYILGVNKKIEDLLNEAIEAEKHHLDQAEKLKPRCGICGEESIAISYSKIGDDARQIRLCADCLSEASEYHKTFFRGTDFEDYE